jgi:carbon-monoxide dehydrogenase medium subunit
MSQAYRLLRPRDLAEAVQMLSSGEEAQLISGGQTLIPSIKHGLARPAALVDLARIEALRGIRMEGNALVIGAMTTHAEVAASRVVRQALPALAELAGEIADRMVRNMGTLGGSVANNDPAADYPAALLALGATVVTDRREIAAADFFVDMFTTALQAGEIVVAVRFPPAEAAAYAKFRNPASRYAIVGAFVARNGKEVRVAITGAAGVVFRFTEMERALAASFTAAAAEGVTLSPDGLNGDIHASAAYRAQLATVMSARAVAMAGARK